MHEAKTNFSRLLAGVEQGREYVIMRAGKPIAKLVPFSEQPKRRPGGLEGRIWIAPDFDELPAELLAAFEGEESE